MHRPTNSLRIYNDYKKTCITPEGTPHALVPPLLEKLVHPQLPSSDAKRWLAAVVSVAEASSQEGVFKLLRGNGHRQSTDYTVPVINLARSLITKAFPTAWTSPAHSPMATAARASLHLYYRSLHKLLLAELEYETTSEGLESVQELSAVRRDGVVASVVARRGVLTGLVTACAEVAVFVGMEQPEEESFPKTTLSMGCGCYWMELLQGIWWLQESCGQDPDDIDDSLRTEGDEGAAAGKKHIDTQHFDGLPHRVHDVLLVGGQLKNMLCFCAQQSTIPPFFVYVPCSHMHA